MQQVWQEAGSQRGCVQVAVHHDGVIQPHEVRCEQGHQLGGSLVNRLVGVVLRYRLDLVLHTVEIQRIHDAFKEPGTDALARLGAGKK